jgi:hypothetical protein
MKITANLLDPSIVTSTLPPTDRFSSREATPTAPLDLDTPLKRLCKNAMSGEEAISLLQKFSMLPQFQRELILEAELASVSCSQEEMFSAYKTFYRKYQINSDAERDTWLVRNKCTLAQLEHSVLRTLKLDRFKQTTFGHKVESYFLQRKSQLDRVIYSLLRVKDPHLAQEHLPNLSSNILAAKKLMSVVSSAPTNCRYPIQFWHKNSDRSNQDN